MSGPATDRPLREARVDLAAITHNVETLRALIGTPHFMAVVKSGAYGHGAIPTAKAALAGGADWLGVVDIGEALELRAAGISAPILAWLHGPRADFAAAIAADVDLGVSYLRQLEQVVAAGVGNVHVKVDTGLGRNGAADAEWPALFEAAAALERSGRVRVRGLWSHLSNTDDTADLAQVAAFERAIELARDAGLDPELLHLAATAGGIRLSSTRFSMVRVGLGCVGLSPFDDVTSAALGLRPALELSAAVVSVKRVPVGTGVSYGHTYRTGEHSTLALVPLGYSDGVPRHASNRGPVSISGRHYRVAGRVAMDQFVVDVGEDAVAVGDRAVLFGDPSRGAPSAEEWATAADTINYELVTRLGGRIEWTYS